MPARPLAPTDRAIRRWLHPTAANTPTRAAITYSGFRRYHSDCHVCHGPNGEGSSYAPALAESLKTLSYTDFAEVVTNGRKNVDAANDKVMPSFAENSNVMCFLDDIYVYLRARANGAIPGGRPPKHEDKSEAARQAETSCTGIK